MSSHVSTVVSKMIAYFDGDTRRINHALKVYGFAKSIGELEGIGGIELEVLEIAGVLHDIGIKESERKYSSSAGKYQEIEGPPVARELIKDLELSYETVERISYLIGNHHSYTKIDGIDFQVLVEADFLVNIFEDSIEKEAAAIAKEKYFKTATGIRYMESMYGV